MPADDTSQKINVYNLGEKGVNLTKSPLHIEDGELVAAQNAEFYLDEGLGAIRKRPGLQRLNTSILAGAVRGVIGVPLPGPGRRSVYCNQGFMDAAAWSKTTDGATWATVNFIAMPGSDGTANANYQPLPISVNPIPGQFFYVAENGADVGIIYGYDGTAEFELARLADALFNIRLLTVFQGVIYIAELANGGVGRMWQLDPVSGDLTLIGSTLGAGSEFVSAGGYLGKIFAGTAEATQGKLYSARPGATAWTLERTAVANQQAYASVIAYKGELFAATSALAGTAAIIEKRTVAGVWSTTRTGGTSAVANSFDGLVVHMNELYALYHTDPTSGTHVAQVHKYDGTSWSTDLDLSASGVFVFGGRLSVGSSLFAAARPAAGSTKGIWRKLAGVWSKVDNFGEGVMGVI